MRPALRRFAAPILVALAASQLGCASGGNPARTPTDRSVITREQIVEHHFTNAYDAVQALHSNWLQTKVVDSFQSPSAVRVYVDNTSLGGVDTLRSLDVGTIRTIQFFDGIAATARWGIDHGAGVILVTTHQ